jgi:alanine dehydrogenase
MKVLVVNQSEVKRLLPMRECISVMAQALQALARGEVQMPLRQVTWLADKKAALASMPAYMPALGAMGVKVITVFPDNLAAGLDSHQGVVLLFEANNGRLLSIMDATEITAIRTAAVSGVATQALALPDTQELAIFGSGVQARTHLEAMLCVSKISRVRVWSRNAEHAQSFASRYSEEFNVAIDAVADPQQAAKNATLICTTTAASAPVLAGEWLSAGAHINAAGAYGASNRELDSHAVANSRMYVDRRESTMNESGDFLIPLKEGIINESHIVGEIGELLIGKIEGRTSADEITLFKSMGIAVEDLASANFIYHKAAAEGGGTYVELGGSRV